ncbi:MAG: hypothetical protein FD126_2979 [Elusimicrobia bacterium]|nr:MAG: hypothetical protein FD126_2979 [Elusimicrobiota bacterium]
MSETLFRALTKTSAPELERILRFASAPVLTALAGYEWAGLNVGGPLAVLGGKKFIMGFFRGSSGAEGYHIGAVQDGPLEPWRYDSPVDQPPARSAFFRAGRVKAGSRDARYPRAALLDYGAGRRKSAWSFARLRRDYLVQPDPSDAEVLLGRRTLALGQARLAAHCFVLRRLRSTTWAP